MVGQPDAQPNARQWEAEQLRATFFVAPGVNVVDSGSWWESVVGAPPEEVRNRPGERTIHTSGSLHGKHLTLINRPERIDWIFQARIEPSDAPPSSGFPSLGPHPEQLRQFLRLLADWSRSDLAVVRLAMGSILVKPMATLAQGYRELALLLPSAQYDAEKVSDLFYQINRPRPSQFVSGLRINRLSKWSVMQAGSIGLTLGPEGGAVLPSPPSRYACRLELDINTAVSRHALSSDQIGSLLGELEELGLDIADRGDIE